VLTVRLDGKVAGSATRSVKPVASDLPPAASATCTWDANTWTATVIDTSTDPDATSPVDVVTVDWGDLSDRSVGAAGDTLIHTYFRPSASHTLTFTAIDTSLRSNA